MNNILKKEAQLAEEEKPETPRPSHQVLFLPEKVTAAAGGRAAGTRTRPPGSRFNKPTKEDLEYYEKTYEESCKFIDEDPVVCGAKGRDTLAFLATLKAEVAREAAALVYQRVVLEKMGKDITQISGRRIDALKKIADIEMEMLKIGFDHIDVRSEKFQKVFKMWIETIQSVAEQVLSPEELDLFFNRLSTEMEGWEDKAEDLVR